MQTRVPSDFEVYASRFYGEAEAELRQTKKRKPTRPQVMLLLNKWWADYEQAEVDDADRWPRRQEMKKRARDAKELKKRVREDRTMEQTALPVRALVVRGLCLKKRRLPEGHMGVIPSHQRKVGTTQLETCHNTWLILTLSNL